MKLSAQWIREFVDVPVDDGRLVEDLTSIGIAVEGICGKGGDIIFEMEIGTNRPDAMNHHGVAREAAALYGVPLKPIEASAAKPADSSGKGNGTAEAVPSRSELSRGRKSSNDFEIDIDDAEGCARYTAQIVRGLNIEASPANVASRLALVDQRSINNAADASNYTLWEMGHPTHAFDLDLLEGGKIIVRRARQGETLKTLDGIDRKLSPDDLIIADANRPVALAGVMGGFDTMITERTKNILIESAWFDPVAVRRTAKRHGMHTDASHRFERGADPESIPEALDLAASLLLAAAGGILAPGRIDARGRPFARRRAVLRLTRLRLLSGDDRLDLDFAAEALSRLGFSIAKRGGNTPGVSTPPARQLFEAPFHSGLKAAHVAISTHDGNYEERSQGVITFTPSRGMRVTVTVGGQPIKESIDLYGISYERQTGDQTQWKVSDIPSTDFA